MTEYRQKLKYFLVTTVTFWLIGAGCAPKTYRMHPQFGVHCKNIESYGLVQPEVEVCEITAGGMREIRDEWCDLGRKNIIAALDDTLTARQINFKKISVDSVSLGEWKDIYALYKAVSQSIRVHTNGGPHVFPEKVKNFEYSIGAIDRIIQKYNCDSLIIVYASDEISTAGRKALMGLGAIAGAFTGVVVMPRGGATTLNIAVVDSSGDVLWYNSKTLGGYDLRDPGSAWKLVESIALDFPECQK